LLLICSRSVESGVIKEDSAEMELLGSSAAHTPQVDSDVTSIFTYANRYIAANELYNADIEKNKADPETSSHSFIGNLYWMGRNVYNWFGMSHPEPSSGISGTQMTKATPALDSESWTTIAAPDIIEELTTTTGIPEKTNDWTNMVNSENSENWTTILIPSNNKDWTIFTTSDPSENWTNFATSEKSEMFNSFITSSDAYYIINITSSEYIDYSSNTAGPAVDEIKGSDNVNTISSSENDNNEITFTTPNSSGIWLSALSSNRDDGNISNESISYTQSAVIVTLGLTSEDRTLAPSEEKTLSPSEITFVPSLSTKESNFVPSKMSTTKPSLTTEKDTLAFSKKSTLAFSSTSEKSTVATSSIYEKSTLTSNSNNEVSTLAFSLSSEESTMAPSSIYERSTWAPSSNNELSTPAPSLTSENSTLVPSLIGEESTLVPNITDEISTVTPTLTSDARTQAPILISMKSTMAPSLTSMESTKAPSSINKMSTVASDLPNEKSTLAPNDDTLAPSISTEITTVAPYLRSEVSTVTPNKKSTPSFVFGSLSWIGYTAYDMFTRLYYPEDNFNVQERSDTRGMKISPGGRSFGLQSTTTDDHEVAPVTKSTFISSLSTEQPTPGINSDTYLNDTAETLLNNTLRLAELDVVFTILGKALGVSNITNGIDYYLPVVTLKGLISIMESTQCLERLLCHFNVDEKFLRSPLGRLLVFGASKLPAEISDQLYDALKVLLNFRRSSRIDMMDCSSFRCLNTESPFLFDFLQIIYTFFTLLTESGCLERIACEWSIIGVFPEIVGSLVDIFMSQNIGGIGNSTTVSNMARTVTIMSLKHKPRCENITCGFSTKQKY
ncbi:hypothetical protein SK128_023802, partial [Halocaridina rubra]